MTKEALMQMLNEINAGLKTALTRVNELVAENKALKEALAQPEQGSDMLTIAYMSGLYKGRKLEREACAVLAEKTICDTHIPTGINIYGTRAAKAIRARGNT